MAAMQRLHLPPKAPVSTGTTPPSSARCAPKLESLQGASVDPLTMGCLKIRWEGEAGGRHHTEVSVLCA